MSRGKFITFEGGEGAGKSTQVQRLAARLQACGITAVTTREPGGSAFGEQVRAFILSPETAPHAPLAEACLFSAARADHLDKIIRPALARGDWVISDRFTDSTRAYQGAAGGVPADDILALERLVLGSTAIDLTVVLDLDARVGLTRADARRTAQTQGTFMAADTFEARTLAFHERLRAGFLAIAAAEPQRVAVIDGRQNAARIDDQVWALIAERMGLASAPKGLA
jgi:dTMP kinase